MIVPVFSAFMTKAGRLTWWIFYIDDSENVNPCGSLQYSVAFFFF